VRRWTKVPEYSLMSPKTVQQVTASELKCIGKRASGRKA
jgi:hypothetical protein